MCAAYDWSSHTLTQMRGRQIAVAIQPCGSWRYEDAMLVAKYHSVGS